MNKRMEWVSAFGMAVAFAGFLVVASVAVFHWSHHFHPWYHYLPYMALCLAMVVPNYMLLRTWREW